MGSRQRKRKNRQGKAGGRLGNRAGHKGFGARTRSGALEFRSGVQTTTKSLSAKRRAFIESSPIHASGAGGVAGGLSVVATRRLPKAALSL